ncbi:MAG TPA: GNAT family N-acetyltransferase, partial [Chloroflexota bacterium]|nr:GNAT family N-acetyltransferase [Chloroflexota bacterium]
MTDFLPANSLDSPEYILLRDGSQVLIRRLAPGDVVATQEFFRRLSPESRAFRFHSGGASVGPEVVGQALDGHTLVAERNDRVVGLASYYPLRDPERAEMALAVDDAEQGKGIGTVLFERLSADARREGIQQFLALVLAANRKMNDLLRNLGFALHRTIDSGEIEYTVELREDESYVAAADARRHLAASASLEPLFHPRSVAVVGASRQRGSIGHELLRNLLAGGFAGPVYPVNPNTLAVASVRAYPRVSAIPDPVDLAIIVVPAAVVLDAARDCLDAGVKALVVISAGFAEVGAEGRARQDELLTLCRSHGVRLVGPNCMGILVNSPDGAMNATFAPVLPPPGNVSVASQSGALGIAILQQAKQLGIGIASFVSMGNKADLSSNDLIERWEDNPATDVILLYLESFGNPRRFGRVARRVGRRKPIIAVKGGRAPAGQRA